MDCKTAHLLLDFNRPPSELEASEAEVAGEPPDRLPRVRRGWRATSAASTTTWARPCATSPCRPACANGSSPGSSAPKRCRCPGAASRAAPGASRLPPHSSSSPSAAPFSPPVRARSTSPAPPRILDAVQSGTHPGGSTGCTPAASACPAPDMFEYNLLTHYHVASLQGQRVPMLLFTSSNHRHVVSGAGLSAGCAAVRSRRAPQRRRPRKTAAAPSSSSRTRPTRVSPTSSSTTPRTSTHSWRRRNSAPPDLATPLPLDAAEKVCGCVSGRGH